MARPKGDTPSRASYYRQIFVEHPEWLKPGSNKAVRERWSQDHSGKKMPREEEQAMANVKSLMKRNRRKGKGGKKAADGAAAAPAAAPVPTTVLERLEIAIDKILSKARDLDAQRLDKVVKHLRLARNEVVIIIGE